MGEHGGEREAGLVAELEVGGEAAVGSAWGEAGGDGLAFSREGDWEEGLRVEGISSALPPVIEDT